MAIYNGRILMRKGNEADFDASKLMSGEWAVSLDAGIVRICLEAGKVIRMATYEAFEEDMKQIEAILLECQSIEEAVRRINTEVSEKLNACAEYVQQAKNYSEQAKTSEANAKSYMQSAKTSEANAKVSETNAKASENSAKEYENSAKLTEERAREVFESIPEDYSTISKDLYELAIKENASGEEIHVNDSSNLKLREFALYGKAKQNTTTGNQLLDYENNVTSREGLVVTVNDDKSLTIKGSTSSNYIQLASIKNLVLEVGNYYVSGGSNSSGNLYVQVQITLSDGTKKYYNNKSFTIDGTEQNILVTIQTGAYSGNIDCTIYPMINKGTTALPFEPFTNGASPNPQYPQPIEVSGASGSVEVKSVGKNLINPNDCIQAFLNAENGTTQSSSWWITTDYIKVKENEQIRFSSNAEIVQLIRFVEYNSEKKYIKGSNLSNTEDITLNVGNTTKYIRLSFGISSAITKEDFFASYSVQLERGNISTEIEPYKETLATIPTENGLASVNDAHDVIVKYADGSGEKIQRVYKFNVEELTWTYSDSAKIFTCSLNPTKKEGITNVVCSALTVTNVGSTSQMADNTIKGGNDVTFIIAKCLKYTSVEDFVNGLKGQEIYYELKTPITTPLTAEEIAEIEKLHTFYPVTNISNDFDCGMSVTYYCDSKNYISNQLAIMKQEQEEAMANMLLLMPTEVQAMMIENDTNDLLKESEI